MRIHYSDTLLEHFERPRYVGRLDHEPSDIGTALVGNPETGGILALHIQVDENGLIREACFQAYGPPALIAAGSWLTESIRGGNLEQAEAVTQQTVAEALELPPARIYCAMLAEDAIKAATKNFKDKQRAFV